MRCMIPKSIKTQTYIYKRLTIIDMLIFIGLLGVTYLIYTTNIPNKIIYMVIVPVILAILTLFKPNDIRLVTFFSYSVKFALSPKEFSRSNGKIDRLLPVMKFTDKEGFIEFSNSYYGVLIQIDSIEFILKTLHQQDQIIIDFGQAINSIGDDEKLQLIKVDQPIIYDDYLLYLNKKFEEEQSSPNPDQNRLGLLQTRIEQVDIINSYEKQYTQFFYFALYSPNLEKLEAATSTFISYLNTIELRPKVLNDKQFAIVNRYLYSRDFNERMFNKLDKSEYLDNIYPDKIVFNRKGFVINDQIRGFTYAINDYPLMVENAWGVGLFSQSNTKIVVNITPIDNYRGIKQIDRASLELRDRFENLHRPGEIMDNELALESINQLLVNLKQDNEKLFNVNILITAYDYDKVKHYQTSLNKELTNMSLSYFLGYNRQIPFFMNASMNKRPVDKVFGRSINTYSIACAFPFVFTRVNDAKGMMIGVNDYPVILDIRKWKYDDSGRYVNANAFTLGKSGKGKSFFTKMLLELLISDNNRMYILDPENEYMELVHNFNGKYIDVGEATAGRFNPFQFYQNMTEDEDAKPQMGVEYSKHLQMLSTFFQILLPNIDSDASAQLDNLIKLTYAGKGIVFETDISNLTPLDYPIFDDLWSVLEKQIEMYAPGTINRANYDKLAIYMAKFVKGSAYSLLWNGPSTIETNENLVVFNFQSLTSNNKITANAQMLLVMRYLEQQVINIRQFNRNKPVEQQVNTFIAIDEGYIFVNENFPIALQYIYEWYKRARKYNVSMYFATQNLGDIVGNKEVVAKTSAIIANSQYHFIFGLAELEMEVLDKVYAGRINETEKDYIMNAKKGQCFLISSERERTFFQVVAHDIVRQYFEKKFDIDVLKYLDLKRDEDYSPFAIPDDEVEDEKLDSAYVSLYD